MPRETGSESRGPSKGEQLKREMGRCPYPEALRHTQGCELRRTAPPCGRGSSLSDLLDFTATYVILSSKKFLTFEKNISIMKFNGSRKALMFLEARGQGSRATIQIWVAVLSLKLELKDWRAQ